MLLPVTSPDPRRRPHSAADAAAVAPRRRALSGGLILAVTGVCAALVAAASNPGGARSAASQVWSPFVLVAGLLLIGLVADADGLFAAAGHALARIARNGLVLYAGSMLLVAVVTAVLNLDTSVAFLTPVLVYTARSRGEGHAPLLYGCLLLSNAASLVLPGSNLTNLIVLGHLHLSGGRFLAALWPAALAAILVTATVVAICERRSLRTTVADLTKPDRPQLGLGLLAVVAAATLVVVLRSPALPVAAVGVIAAGVRVARRAEPPGRFLEVLGLPVLVGLFGIAVALGTLGRAWSGPATLLSHLNSAARPRLGRRRRGAREQPAGRGPARRPGTPTPLRVARRPEPGSQPLHDRLPGMDPVATRRTNRRRRTVHRPRQPPRGHRRPAIHRRSARSTHSDRRTLTTGPPQAGDDPPGGRDRIGAPPRRHAALRGVVN